jgi:hypothetical protein
MNLDGRAAIKGLCRSRDRFTARATRSGLPHSATTRLGQANYRRPLLTPYRIRRRQLDETTQKTKPEKSEEIEEENVQRPPSDHNAPGR